MLDRDFVGQFSFDFFVCSSDCGSASVESSGETDGFDRKRRIIVRLPKAPWEPYASKS